MATVLILHSTLLCFLWWSGTQSRNTEATKWPIGSAPIMMNDDEFGANCEMLGRRKRSTRRQLARVPLFPPKVRHELCRARTLGRRGGKLATNCLSYGTSLRYTLRYITLRPCPCKWLRIYYSHNPITLLDRV
jgi:hypothetical protein